MWISELVISAKVGGLLSKGQAALWVSELVQTLAPSIGYVVLQFGLDQPSPLEVLGPDRPSYRQQCIKDIVRLMHRRVIYHQEWESPSWKRTGNIAIDKQRKSDN